MVVAKKRREDQADRDTSLAWRVAALMRQKKLPALQSLLISAKKRKQTAGEMAAVLHTLSGQFGGPVRKGSRGR